MEEEKKYIVYKHTSPSGKVYIGITSKENPEERWKPNGNGYYKNSHLQNAIKKYKWENFEHEVLFQGLTKDEACQKEIELIALYDSTNTDKGYNNSLGGEINIPSEETRKKMSEIAKARFSDPTKHPLFGKHLSEETKKKLSEAPGHYTKETREKISAFMKERLSNPENHPLFGTHLSQEHIDLLTQTRVDKLSVAVLQYDMDGNFIAEYKNAAEASEAVGVHKSAIECCCRNKQHSSAGYIWKYKDEDYDFDNNHIIPCTQKAVVQFDTNGNFVAEYKSVSDAMRETGILSLRKACQRKQKTSGGFIWRFKGDCDDIIPVQPGLHRCAKTVLQFDQQGNLIAEYSSGHEADRANGLARGIVGQCCRGHLRTAGGFHWRYKDEYEKELNNAE